MKKMVVNISASNVCIDYIGNVPMFWAHSAYCFVSNTRFNLNVIITMIAWQMKSKRRDIFFLLLLFSFVFRCANVGKRTENKHNWTKISVRLKRIRINSLKMVLFYCLPFLIYLNVNNWEKSCIEYRIVSTAKIAKRICNCNMKRFSCCHPVR